MRASAAPDATAACLPKVTCHVITSETFGIPPAAIPGLPVNRPWGAQGRSSPPSAIVAAGRVKGLGFPVQRPQRRPVALWRPCRSAGRADNPDAAAKLRL